ncbi:hypothetical protein ES319_A08G034300v1 [Gossypium barbadense]|uniref:Hyaluronan/mRNA-binding protein domain-containing protein n=1 Tax=Gossypium barbadense TaxID=3634 RepID=A0A5J5UM04_GOSBA|nr:hypothetical protein ES319_A08G034300v1 [Gossypium barbadense]
MMILGSSLLIAAQKKAAATAPSGVPKKGQAQSQTKPQAKLPSKPLPPAQAVREAKSEGTCGGGRGGRGGGGGYRHDFANDENSFSNSAELSQGAPEDGESRRPLKGVVATVVLDLIVVVVAVVVSVIGKLEMGRDLAGCMNAVVGLDAEMSSNAKALVMGIGELKLMNLLSKQNLGDEKLARDGDGGDADKESLTNELEEKEPEEKVMTLEEYEELMEEKRKALQALKTEGRKVDAKEFESMQQLSNKKSNDEIFIKLGSDKDKRKEAYEKEERAKKSLSINEFLKPAERKRYYNPSGRGRGRGQDQGRGHSSRGFGGGNARSSMAAAPSIEDRSHFPTLGGK